ncbi:MAG: cupin domain-containing protein [Rhodospirillaceae bacterium]
MAKIAYVAAVDALRQATKPFIRLFTHGTLEVELFQPVDADHQSPHDRDEVYVVVSGTGEFVCGPERVSFAGGDVLFVPAGTIHRFEKFSDDLSVWVLFYGPVGGEAPQH